MAPEMWMSAKENVIDENVLIAQEWNIKYNTCILDI